MWEELLERQILSTWQAWKVADRHLALSGSPTHLLLEPSEMGNLRVLTTPSIFKLQHRPKLRDG